jgi:hypothetical protein
LGISKEFCMQRHAKVLRLLCSIVVVGLLALSLSGCWSLPGGGTTGLSGGGNSGSGDSSGKPTVRLINQTGNTLTVLLVYKDITGASDNANNLLTSPLANGSSITVTLGSTGTWIVVAGDAGDGVWGCSLSIDEVKAYNFTITPEYILD